MKTFPQNRAGLMAKLLAGFVVLAVAAGLLWIWLLPRLLVGQIAKRTGFAMQVEHLSVNPFTADVQIRGLIVQNPSGWPESDFLQVREFSADADMFSLFRSRLVIDDAAVDVAQVTVVRNEQGVLNAMAFRDGLTGGAGAATPAPARAAKSPTPAREFLIRHLTLKFDKLVVADYTNGQPTKREYAVNLNQQMQNVDSMAKLAAPFSGTAISIFTDSLAGVLKDKQNLLKNLSNLLQNSGKTGEKLKGLLDSLDKRKP